MEENMKRILVVDDEQDLCEILKFNLETEGYEVETANSAEEALEMDIASFDLLLLDVMMGGMSGFQLAKQLKGNPMTANVPIIFLTARDTENDTVTGFNIGADDYISKPYNAQVLLARIQKLLARTYEVQDNVVLTHKGLTLNLLKAEISYQGQRKSLTKNEMGILRLLMVNKGNIIPRDAIIDELWQSEQFIDENTLNVNIVRLRKTLAEIGLPDYLETKRGLGYCV